MRRIIVVSAVALCFFASIAEAKVKNRYDQWRLGQPFGYRDLEISPTRWKIRGLSLEAGSEFTRAVVLHRAAIHAKANGFGYFFAVSLKIRCSDRFSSGFDFEDCKRPNYAEEVNLIAVGVNDPAMAPACEERGRWAKNCGMFAVDETLASAGTILENDATQQATEIGTSRTTTHK